MKWGREEVIKSYSKKVRKFHYNTFLGEKNNNYTVKQQINENGELNMSGNMLTFHTTFTLLKALFISPLIFLYDQASPKSHVSSK